MPTLVVTAWRRVVGALSLTGAGALAFLSVSSVPAGAQGVVTTTAQACPVLLLGNPNPGDLLSPGGYIVFGEAFDPSATSGPGIQRVDLFLGRRDAGGQILASTIPGQNASGNSHAFQVKVTIPDVDRSDHFVAYAYSAISSAQTSVDVPVNIGAVPTPTPRSNPAPRTPEALSQTVQTLCTPLAVSGVSSTPAPAPAVATTPAPAVATGTLASQRPILQLANPNPGDLLNIGGYVVNGLAFDPSAPQGQSGVDQVSLFLGDRDQGGMELTITTPGQNTANPREFTGKVKIPSNVNGAHMFFAYAHSSITGAEAVTSVPVFVGVPPTATPRPS